MVAAVGYLMVSTWRFYSFKDIDFRSRRPFRLIIFMARLFARHLVVLAGRCFSAVALLYTFSGVFWRLQWIFRRRRPAAAAHLQGGFADFMSSPSKIAASSASASARGQLYRAAIVGAGTLKGKEVAEMLNERNFPAVDVRLLDDDESIGQLEATGDEINFIQSVRAEQFTKVDFTFFAADEECTRQNWKRARDAGSAIVDLSGALEEEPGATIRSLWVERERGQIWQPELQPAPCVVAHPAAVTLALLLLRARKAGAIRSAAATVFEPASEQGQRGMDELHQQTVNLLSFQPLPKDVFDTQVAFNMVARYGQKSKLSLDSLEAARAAPLSKDCRNGRAPARADVVAASSFSRPRTRDLPGDGASRRSGEIVAGSCRRSRDGRGSGRRFAAEQREHGWSGEHPGFVEGRIFAAQWSLAMGGRGQPARRGYHCGGMCREHDRQRARWEKSNEVAARRSGCVLLAGGLPVADTTRPATPFSFRKTLRPLPSRLSQT